ncbi:MAG TPA: hypothetical protein VM933_10235 [Acidimicrobiales bacterium]|nr:hypothetical protein [Acidimicrobiales bacterium]
MTAHSIAAIEGAGSELASWSPLVTLLVVFGVIVVALVAFGRRGGGTTGPVAAFLLRTPDALQRLTGVPGWAAATVGLSLYGLLIAGEGFYSDVAWHITLGRDDALFTAPHTSIVLGLGCIFLAGLIGIGYASLQQVDTALRWKAVRIPWSTLPLLALGGAALLGFPLDEVWHQTYGVDVTMWSPTHMLMILGASFSGLASWLVLAEAGVRPGASRWGRGMLVVASWLTLQGLSAPLGEFSFGVPQFQQMFHPLILCIAAGFAIVAIRLVHGRGWALGITVGNFVLMSSDVLSLGGETAGPVETRDAGLFIASALVVELVALLVGTRDGVRFAVAAGLGVGTFGLAGEWWWNQGAYQPWNEHLLPDAVILGTIGAVAAALVGLAFARAAGQAPVREATRGPAPWVVALAGTTVLVVLALPMPRDVGEVEAAVTIEPAAAPGTTPLADPYDQAFVDVQLTPANAADEARWFQVSAWQGGGLVLADLERVTGGPAGRYRTTEPVPVDGAWKTIVRLHRGGEVMAVPVFLPADPEIAEPEVSAIDRTQPFEAETRYLLRETRANDQLVARLVYALLAVVGVAWIAAFALAAARLVPGVGPRPRPPSVIPSPA